MLMRIFACLLCAFTIARAEWIWVEGEKAVEQRMNRHPWYAQVKKEHLSGGDFVSNFHGEKAGEALYRFKASESADYQFWIRANPLAAKLSYSLNDGPEVPVNFGGEKRGEVNVAADSKPDLRFLAWIRAGTLKLKQGENTIRFRMTSENNHHGYLDCFVLSSTAFQPRGLLKPDEMAADLQRLEAEAKEWFAFDPPPDAFRPSPMDLRHLNERFAGENGFIAATNGTFVHSATRAPVRFWAVNGPPHDLKGEDLRKCARMLARRGVNLVRVHGGLFDSNGEPDPAKVRHAMEVVQAMKAEGIYTHFSIYFPLWMQPKADTPWLRGYDGTKNPFAALQFNRDFQAQYRKWWDALLTTRDEKTGKTLLEESAVFGLEIQNEDSFFFWTFDEKNLPDEQLRMVEKLFGDWLIKRHGSIEKALAAWKGPTLKRDAPGEGRVAFRPLWAIFNEKTLRDQETAQFLLEVQTGFYRETYNYLRRLGFKGVINASNWSTASPEVFGPLEKLSYTVADFVDRHGYFSCNHKGENAAWSIRDGHTYSDRSALRFAPEQPGKGKLFVHPAMDPHYDDKPSMLSESTWNRPNRYRSEAPLYFAAYGALQDSDAIVHFALDGENWAVKPRFHMQPWTLMSPSMMGQFPAAALIYRQGLIAPGAVVADIGLNIDALRRLEGTPLPQDAALDELRAQDVPGGFVDKAGSRIDPLFHYVGRTQVRFTDSPASTKLSQADKIDRKAQRVTSSTGELQLDYGAGRLTLNAPRAQGISGNLKSAGVVSTADLKLESAMELGHIVVVALDGQPLATSKRMLLQVMSEEKPAGFSTEAAGVGVLKITSVGTDPWLVRELKGRVSWRRQDASQLKVQALDQNGYPAGPAGSAADFQLLPRTMYYLVGQ